LVRQVGLLWLAAVIDRVGHLGRERSGIDLASHSFDRAGSAEVGHPAAITRKLGLAHNAEIVTQRSFV
jgi:hypothetical protein